MIVDDKKLNGLERKKKRNQRILEIFLPEELMIVVNFNDYLA